MANEEVLLNGQAVRYADMEKFRAVAGSGQLVATVCLACAYCELTAGSESNNNKQFISLLEVKPADSDTELKTEPPLKCSDKQDMERVEFISRLKAGPQTPINEICPRFVVRTPVRKPPATMSAE